jgi:hypothetical protein
MIKQIGVSFTKVSAMEAEDQLLSVPFDARIFELPSGGYLVIPGNRTEGYTEEQLNGIVADVDSMLCGDDLK